MPESKPRIRRAHNREATEQALLDACGRLLLRDGPDGIRVNNVVTEAGVGKDLIYRYFGGLPGLIKAWLDNDANWPTAEELTGGNNTDFANIEVGAQVQLVCRNYITALRNRPVIMRLLVSEIMRPTDVTAILEEAGDRIGKELFQSLQLSNYEHPDDVVDVALIFTIMTNYLCMRAATNPLAFGMDLANDASWERVTRIMETLIERYLR
jgi:AcrR family transcriptional regulator